MPRSACEQLTPTEREVLRMLTTGLRVTAVAKETGRRESTARTHVKHLHQKTGTHDIPALVRWAESHRSCCVG
ncbi:MAG: response regulator transcription factor [Dehalococcoidia bacterium]|nr:LuxR C-terminal-related transcriptional regulator [Dehalococcoidia bacterium]MCL4232467.1 hypothetical protein [Dehalococcoidia bacterium]NUQ55514.1 response regulator transcription factor [Dehalococcoidia bacterium]RIL02911.1 MAG: hypothetical protein DCC78_05565 [bacterium]